MSPPAPQDMSPQPPFACRPTSEHLAAARAVLGSARQQIEDRTAEEPRLAALLRDLAASLAFNRDHVAGLLQRAGISDPLRETLTQERIDRFINAAYTSPPKPPAARPPSMTDKAPRQVKDHREQQRQEHHASKRKRSAVRSGNSARDSSRHAADFYQAITELTIFGSTPAERELSLIAADQFGVHG